MNHEFTGGGVTTLSRPAHVGYSAESLLTDHDLYLFNEGTHARLYEKLGAHPRIIDGFAGVQFAVWAPNARDVTVAVYGEGNPLLPHVGESPIENRQPIAAYGEGNHPLRPRGRSGIWEAFVPGVGPGAVYKYRIQSQVDEYQIEKADPFGFYSEIPPRTASVVHSLDYDWRDQAWIAARAGRNALDAPWAIYELHLGSWRRTPDGFWLSYRELAAPLVEYLRRTGFTHVEFMPLGEHPFFGSWGYQTVGYFAPTARYGTPQDLMYLIDQLHQNGFGVVLDWVPSHFPGDGHGLSYFDGTHLYEHADPRQSVHPDWNTFIFNFGRNEVRSFMLSSALFWLDKYHIDGLRVDAVASMLHLDYSRRPGEWIPNEFGGAENLAAIHFLRDFNRHVYAEYPDVQTFAEESSSWPMVSRPTHVGGLGFGFKWDMGWMHDTLRYMGKDPIFRRYEHSALTFRAMYACSENFVLSLSHDEVVYGKGSLVNKMPGDDWRKFANLRLLLGFMYALPGKKLLFMGDEFGARDEWNHDAQLDWNLLDMAPHGGVLRWVADLNRVYREEPALFELDFQPEGFEWIDCCDSEQSVISFFRRGRTDEKPLVAVCNFTPVVRRNYRLGVPWGGWWRELLNSDARDYGGSGQGNLGGVEASPIGTHGRPCSLNITLPPLAMVLWKQA